MSLPYTQEQLELKDTVHRFLSENCSSAYIRKRIESTQKSDVEVWKKLNELGLISAFANESLGGVGLGFRELGIIAYESGWSLLPEPLYQQAFFTSYLLSNLVASEELKKLSPKLVSGLLGGERKLTVCAETGVTNLKFSKNTLSADLSYLEWPTEESVVVVIGGPGIYLVDLKENGSKVEFTECSLVDLTIKSASLKLKSVSAIEVKLKNPELISTLLGILKASELAGLSDKGLSLTVEHVKTRKQFDAPIGSFQAVQHKLADAYLGTSAMKALSTFAAWTVENSPEQVTLAGLSALKFAVDKCSNILEVCIQLHGGTGFTWEYDLHLYLRRAKMIEALYSKIDLQPLLKVV